MKKMMIVAAMVLAMASVSLAADVGLRWDAVTGATGYKVYMSLDNCATWLAPRDVGNVLTYIYTGGVRYRVGPFQSQRIQGWRGGDSCKSHGGMVGLPTDAAR